MRRRRQPFQVSTFPFLAVLLCTMGALILLLLVLDRRAKIVARLKATHAAEVAQAERQEREEAERARIEAAAAQQAEWERRRQALHDELLRTQADLERQEHDIEERQRSILRQTEATAAQTEQVTQQLEEEKRRLVHVRQDLARTEEAVAGLRREDERSREEMARLAARLGDLERTLAALKAAQERQTRTYSVVPFTGRHGDSRRPLYIEFTGRGLIFHPEKARFEGSDFEAGKIREEVELRVRQQREALRKPGREAKPEEKPYLMLLVRPEGIIPYYQTLQALRPLELDVGYEFIDPDWLLSFPSDDTEPSTQPWMVQRNRPVETAPSSGGGPRVSGMRTRDGGPGTSPLPGGELPLPGTGAEGGNRPGGEGPRSGPGGTGVAGLSQPVPLDRQGSEQKAGTNGSPTGVGAKPPLPGSPETGGGDGERVASSGVEPPPPLPGQGQERAEGNRGGSENGTTGERQREEQPGERGDGGGGGIPGSPEGGRSEPALPRLVGNRDWVIALECRGDAVILKSAGQKFVLGTLQTREGAQTFRTELQRFIDRRQATVRPGDPLYRPQIRFLVRPEGVRTYFTAYPLLEPLGLPLTRQNVETSLEE